MYGALLGPISIQPTHAPDDYELDLNTPNEHDLDYGQRLEPINFINTRKQWM